MSFPLLALSFLVIGSATIGGALLTRRYALFGLLGSTLLLALHGRVFHNYLTDDAFIFFRYARNLADGHGPIWNAGEDPVEGYTGILWLLPLATAAKLGLDIPETARYLGFALGVGALAMLYPLAAALPGGRRYPLAPVLAGLLLAAAPPFALWTFAGMEMPLFIFLVLVAIWLHLREDRDAAVLPWSGVAFALAMATRPEGALFAAVTGAFKLVALLDPASRQRRLVQLFLWVDAIAVLYGGYFLWRYLYYGYLLPNTFYAKVGAGLDVYNRGLHYTADGGNTYGLLLWSAGLAAYLARARPVKPALYLAALTAAWITWLVFSGGDVLLHARFIAPILPLLYLAAALGAVFMLEAPVERYHRLLARPAFALLFTMLLLATLYPSLKGAPSVEMDRRRVADMAVIGRWLAEKLPPDTTIAVERAGVIPYYSRLPTLDMLGLNDEHIAHGDAPVGKGFPGHEKYDIGYVLGKRPQLILLGSDWQTDRPLRTEADYTGIGWLFPNEHRLVNDPRTFALYSPVAMELENGLWLNLLLDKQAPEAVRAVLGFLPSD